MDTTLTQCWKARRRLTCRRSWPDGFQGRRKALEALVNVSQNDWRRRTAFYFGLEAFGRDFQGIESYVEVRLSETAPPVRQALRSISFAYFFGQISLPLQSLTPLFRSHYHRRDSSCPKDSQDHVRELLIEEKTAVRPRAPHNRRRDFATRIRQAWRRPTQLA